MLAAGGTNGSSSFSPSSWSLLVSSNDTLPARSCLAQTSCSSPPLSDVYLSTGCVALWDVQSAAHSSPSTSSSFTSSSSSSSPPSSFDDEFPLPTQYLPIHTAPIRSLSFLRAPQADALGNYHLDWEQTHIISLALNGRLNYTDLRDAAGSGGGGGASVGLRTSRSSASTSTAVSIQNGSVIVADGDYSASVLRIRTHTLSGSGKAVVHQGNIWVGLSFPYTPSLFGLCVSSSIRQMC
jgi:hypothetical protein